MMNSSKKTNVSEATGSANSGKYKVPIVLAPQDWNEEQLGPFTDRVSPFINAELEYEDYDDEFKLEPQETIEKENRTRLISKLMTQLKKSYQGQNDEDGSAINPTMSGLPQKEPEFIKEDLAVWFGTKKKPKGSKQPKGPWVNICRKDEKGKHPPCGRPEAKSTSYPKCRAVHVASKMSASEKRSACQQKRRAEKSNPKIGTGNKPTMVSYKSKNESIESIILKVLKEEYSSRLLYPVEQIYSQLSNAPIEIKKIVSQLTPINCVNDKGEKRTCFRIPEVLYVYLTGRY